MFDLIPWLDETYIVEMGRLFFAGGIGDSILLGRADEVLLPLYYVGPAFQELMFRWGGVLAVRLSPYLGLFLAYCCCRIYLKQREGLTRFVREVLAGSLLFSPLLFQSVLLTRIDSWALACVFAAIAFLGDASAKKSQIRLALGAFFAALSVFIWPTAMVLATIYPVFCFNWNCRRDFLRFCAWLLVAVLLVALPIIPHLSQYWAAFVRHHAEVTSSPSSLMDIVMPVLREVARSPLLALAVFAGIIVWIRDRRYMALIALALAVTVLARSSLYTFRIVYLIPFFFLLVVDAVTRLRTLRGVNGYLVAMLTYGVLTGPIGHFAMDYPTLPTDLKENLAKEIGTGPIRVFAPDHATYYIGRELGWSQRGFARPSELNDAEMLKKALEGCEVAVLRDFDPYTPFQQSCTPYGLFCKYVLSRAKAERALPEAEKSWAARFGGRFSFSWHQPLELNGFCEVARYDMIRVYRRKDQCWRLAMRE